MEIEIYFTSGSRANSKELVHVQTDVSQSDPVLYEIRITKLFLPWLIEEIPDQKWQSLQEKLGMIIREIVSKKN